MRNRTLLAGLCAAGLAGIPLMSAYDANTGAATGRDFSKAIPKEQRIQQALNRLTFGARPGDAAEVKQLGLKKWLDLQLHPERVPQNPALTEKLKSLDTLNMTSEELVRSYPTPQIVKQMVAGQLPYPNDPGRRLLVQRLVARYEKAQAAQDPGAQNTPAQNQAAANTPPNPQALRELLTQPQVRALRTGTREQKLAVFAELTPEKRDELIGALPGGLRQQLFAIAPPDLRRRIELVGGPQQVVARDLAEGKLLRAIYSTRQLEEVLDDFWYNHFNVFLGKGADRYLVTEYEREAIRPHILGKFRDLLGATAKSSAMLFYLDNWQSVGPNAPQPRGPQQKKNVRGLNENYGRELMELHTLGVNGGYTQKDVTEVARCFTGWTILQPQRGGRFVFNPRLHDRGEKVVLGVKIPAGGGQEDGEKVLDILSRQPATARFLSTKLAMRFVADEPPPALVEKMAQTYLKTDGDIRAVLQAMLDSKEFWSEGAYRSKLKSPLEMVASAVRAVNGDVDFAFALSNQVAQLGEPLYRKSEPTGYSNSSKEWLNSGGLLARMNFAVQLAGNQVPGVKVETAQAKAADAVGLSLGSPEFQKR